MLDLEALIGELASTERGLCTIVFCLDLAHLDEHSLNDTVHFRLPVANEFLSTLELFAKGKEVVTCFRCNVMEELNDDLRFYAVHVKVELCELARGMVDSLTVYISLGLLIVRVRGTVEESMVVEGIATELLEASNVLVLVEEDERA